MHQQLARRARALRVVVAIGSMSAWALAQPQHVSDRSAASALEPYAPQPYPVPAPYAQPFAITYVQPSYAGAYALPPVASSQPDRKPTQLEPGEHRFSLLLSIVHPLLFSIYDASGEFRLGKHGGLALVAGVGSASLKQFYKSLPDERARVWAGGLQVRLYPVGSFDHGLQIGGEIVYLTGSASTTGTIATDDDPSMTTTGPLMAKGSGFKAGPFVGYKIALPVGLTFAAQLGVDYLSLKGLAKDANGNSRTGDAKTALLLADAGIGWSF